MKCDRQTKQASLNSFKLLNSHILQGEDLSEIKRISRSILKFGIICPIVTTQLKDSLIVVDGKKRLKALKRLEFQGKLPEQLKSIPYVSVVEAQQTNCQTTSILSGEPIYNVVMALRNRGASIEAIAEHLCLCRHSIADIVVLSRLSDHVRQSYFNNHISFKQAWSYAALPSKRKQTALMLKLGTLADASLILRAIKAMNFDDTTDQGLQTKIKDKDLIKLASRIAA